MPGHCLQRSAALADVERDLQGALHATVAAAAYAHSLERAAAEDQSGVQPLQDTTLRLLAPPVDVVTEWLPASDTTNAAWLLARAAGDSSQQHVDSGKGDLESKGSQEAEQPKGPLTSEVGHAAIEHAARALAACREETAGGAAWQDAALRRYLVAAAMVRACYCCSCCC